MSIIRVTRTLIYEGEEVWVRACTDPTRTAVAPYKPMNCGNGMITELERKEEKLASPTIPEREF